MGRLAGGGFTLSLVFAGLWAGPRPPAPPSAAAPAVTNTHFQQVAPGLFQLGEVRLNSTNKSVSFPAVVNQLQEPVEYLVVATDGKLHESVLKTSAEPYHIHLGMLLLNAKGARVPNDVIWNYDRPITGDPVVITVQWRENGQSREARAEDLVYDIAARKAMTRGEWIYSGSRLFDGVFLAQRDRSIISIIADIDALVNNPRPRRDQDDNWLVNTNVCPALATPVEVTIQLVTRPKEVAPRPRP